MPTTIRARALVLMLGAALCLPTAGAVPAVAAVGACEPAAAGSGPFYPGPSSSATYNETFARGPAIPTVDSHVPQGLTAWKNWNGRGATLLLIGSYRTGRDTYLIGVNPSSGKKVGIVRIAPSHAGALGVAEDWLFVTHRNGDALRKYKLTDLRKAMKKSAATGKKPKIADVGKPQSVVGGNFLNVHDDRVWAGRYGKTESAARMAQYKVSNSGKLSRVGQPWEVPLRTQGVLVTGSRFVFYSGLTSGTITVVRRDGRDLDDFAGRCFAAPSFGQNFVRVDGKVYLNYEGAARTDVANLAHPIGHLHVAKYSELKKLS